MIHFLRKFCQNMVQIPCVVSYGKWSYGKSSHNLNLHQKVRTSNSIKWKNKVNLNTDLLKNCVKSKRPKALVAKQSFVRERITKFISFLIENHFLQLFHHNWWNISIFELNFRKKIKSSANSVHGPPGANKYPHDAGSVCPRYCLCGESGIHESSTILIRNWRCANFLINSNDNHWDVMNIDS